MEIVLSYEIDAYINSLSVSNREDLLSPVLRLVVEPCAGTKGIDAKIDFLLAAGRDVYLACLGESGELNTGDGNAACAGVPQDALARCKFANEEKGLGGGNPGLFLVNILLIW